LNIIIRNAYGEVAFLPEGFEILRNLVLSNERIKAIKFVREKMPHWGLKECKDYVDAIYFVIPSASSPLNDTKALLADLHEDLRSFLLSDYISREEVFNLYDKVVTARNKM
jgi:hypothetical protein